MKVFYWAVFASLILTGPPVNAARAEDEVPAEAAAEQKAEPQVEPKAESKAKGKKAEKAASVKDSGDTYNFYFQKGPAPGKIEQGGSPSVEKGSEPTVPEGEGYTQRVKEKVKRDPSVDLFIGLALLPGQSANGLTLGADFFPTRPLSFRLAILEAQIPDESSNRFGSGGSFGTNTERTLLGGNAAIGFNLFRDEKVRLGPSAGVFFLNDKRSTTTSQFGSMGSVESETGSSSAQVLPYAGIDGTFYFSRMIGANASIILPIEPKYAVITLGFVLSI